MFNRVIGIALAALIAGACQQSSPGTPTTPAGPNAATSMTASGTSLAALAGMAAERPFKAAATWTATGIQWAGLPGQATSTFGGRCSTLSDYVISAAFEGQATHAGRVTGTTSHCSQIAWGPEGPMGATYSDGEGVLTTANGSTINLRYGNGTTGVDPDTGLSWFRDDWTFAGGTGLFAGATGSGIEGGSFTGLDAVLAGMPVPMWMEGTITYNPSGK